MKKHIRGRVHQNIYLPPLEFADLQIDVHQCVNHHLAVVDKSNLEHLEAISLELMDRYGVACGLLCKTVKGIGKSLLNHKSLEIAAKESSLPTCC